MSCKDGPNDRVDLWQSLSTSLLYFVLRVKKVHVRCISSAFEFLVIPYERSFSLVFFEEEWLVGGDPFYLKFWVNRPHWSEIADFQRIIARSALAGTRSKKVQLTLI